MSWPWHENKVFNINLFLLSIKFCLWFFFFRCFILSKLRFYSKACLNFNAICLMVLSVLLVQQKNGKKILKCLFLETTQVLSLLRFFFFFASHLFIFPLGLVLSNDSCFNDMLCKRSCWFRVIWANGAHCFANLTLFFLPFPIISYHCLHSCGYFVVVFRLTCHKKER